MLAILHPALPSCEVCRQFSHDSDFIVRRFDPQDQQSRKMPRQAGELPACISGSCPKGSFWDSRELSEKNRRAYWFNCECDAIGLFPDDDIVRSNAGIIHVAERHARTEIEHKKTVMLETIINLAIAR